MTREKLEQVRELLEEMSYGQAIAILDAELEKPEEREWRVAWQKLGGARESGPFVIRSLADATLSTMRGQLGVTGVRIESRTPAGPWETAK